MKGEEENMSDYKDQIKKIISTHTTYNYDTDDIRIELDLGNANRLLIQSKKGRDSGFIMNDLEDIKKLKQFLNSIEEI